MDYWAKDRMIRDLEDALWELKQSHSSYAMESMELSYAGNDGIRGLIDGGVSQIDDLISKIQEEERDCSEYLQRHCPYFYLATSNYRGVDWLTEEHTEEIKKAKERMKQAVNGIDEYVKTRTPELINSFFPALERRNNQFYTYGAGRPWGGDLRQRMAVAIDLKAEVNSLWELGLNSVANSQHVYLGEHFIDLIKKDNEMARVRRKIKEEVISDIKARIDRDSHTKIQHEKGRIYSWEDCVFGGARSQGDMFEQLKFTLRHPIDSLTEYADTWNVAMQELTWSLRHATVHYDGIYHVVYNMAGFAFVWEMNFSIEDTLDLRPHSKDKINFEGPYNIVTSILGTVYHDLLGNTDDLKVHGHWSEIGTDDEIHEW